MISLDETLNKIRGVLSAELEQPRVNGLTEIVGHKIRRNALHQYMASIDAELDPIRQALKGLPTLPMESEIQWAQAMLALPVCYLEIDTTGLTEQDEIVRVVTVNGQGEVECDLLIKPSRILSAEASTANGLSDADLQDASSLPDVWERIRLALLGRYVLSFGQSFDAKKVQEAATRYHLTPIAFIGDDLQRHATQYYNREYYLRLTDLCERVGYPLKSNSAVDRATGQYHILTAMAEGIMDIRPPKLAASSTAVIHTTNDDELQELDEHPF